jgi:conjugal transfer pilus assembly protein TraA
MQTLTTTSFSISEKQHEALRKALIVTAIILAVYTILTWFSAVEASTTATSADDFDTLVTWVRGQLEGSAGKFLALLGFGIALAAGLIKGSVAGIVFGLGLALSAAYGPGILMGIFSATF